LSAQFRAVRQPSDPFSEERLLPLVYEMPDPLPPDEHSCSSHGERGVDGVSEHRAIGHSLVGNESRQPTVS